MFARVVHCCRIYRFPRGFLTTVEMIFHNIGTTKKVNDKLSTNVICVSKIHIERKMSKIHHIDFFLWLKNYILYALQVELGFRYLNISLDILHLRCVRLSVYLLMSIMYIIVRYIIGIRYIVTIVDSVTE